MLELDNIDVFYGAIQALHGVSLHVDEGEVVTLIGSNGAGKSTALRAISGLMRPSKGQIRFAGKKLNDVRPDEIVKLGICQAPEGRRVFANMTVIENLELGAYSRKDQAAIRSDFDGIFTLFPRLKERSDQMAGTLSGGEQQMLAIGRALMSKPRLLLLDEPSLGLAPVLVKEIFRIIGDISKRGTTILLVEQNAHQSLALASRGYVLESGQVVLEDSAKSLLQNELVRKAYLGE
ncbi:MAG: ABC transporter ATP-binding protein [Armatimonadota bacterium]|nr:ABC transporter ATP-binding protein [Armatimonadota bacterium]